MERCGAHSALFCFLLTQQGSNLAPKCSSDPGKVLILILFLLFAGIFTSAFPVEIDSISPTNPLWHYRGNMCFLPFCFCERHLDIAWHKGILLWVAAPVSSSCSNCMTSLKHRWCWLCRVFLPQNCILILGRFWHRPGLNYPVWYQKAHFGFEGGCNFKPCLSDPSALEWTVAKQILLLFLLVQKNLHFQGFVHWAEQIIFLWLHSTSPPPPFLFHNDIGISLENI